MDNNSIFNDLKKMGIKNILQNENMAKHTTFKVGGIADIFVMPCNSEEVKSIISYIKDNNIDFRVIGNGSNIIVKDEGFRGIIIKFGNLFSDIKISANIVKANAGALLPILSKRAMEQELKGLEFICSVPGSIGGAIITNVGAYGSEIGNYITEVEYLNSDLEFKVANKEDCKFGYRTSYFESKNFIILSAKLELEYGEKEQIIEKMKEYKIKRIESQPLEFPSAGSVFKNPPNNYSAKLIDECGLKGYSVGGAKISQKHAGYIVNYDNATATDILDLISYVKNKVNEEFGIILETEVKIV